MYRRLYVCALVLLVLLLPTSACAHGFGERYTTPIPLVLYLSSAAAVVMLSFAMVASFVRAAPHPTDYPRVNLLTRPWFRSIALNPVLLFGVRVLSVGLFVLTIIAGFVGNQEEIYNFAPTFVWVIWWVTTAFFVALVGNLWPLINPLTILFHWADDLAGRLGAKNGLELRLPYPVRAGVWPAILLYFAFIWTENIYLYRAVPLNLSILILIYAAITWSGMALFGSDVWLARGEAFSLVYSILARFAPTEVRVTNPAICAECNSECQAGQTECVNCYECFGWAAPADRQLNLRPPAVGLLRTEGRSFDRVVFVILILAGVTFDGVEATPTWLNMIDTFYTSSGGTLNIPQYYMVETLGLLAIWLGFLAAYGVFTSLIRLLGSARTGLLDVATRFVYSLVPIALAYQIAHYYTLLLIQGQRLVYLISDPFGRGWNLFGTAGYAMHVRVVSAQFVWLSEIALIVAGHIVAVYLAHRIALRSFPRRALRSQCPMLLLMVLYTVTSLWIIAQPIIVQET